MDASAISSLSRLELIGWHCVVSHPHGPWGREPMPGEIAALHERARALGIVLSAKSSHDALFGSETDSPPPPDTKPSTPS